jgi:anti-sigma B factor antagonist
MLDIKTRNVGDITVLDLSGSLLIGLGLELLRPRIEKLAAEQHVNVVLNAQDVSVIDSAGVGDLVASYSLLKRSGGSLKIANPGKMVRDVLRIARIPTLIEVFDTVDEAVAAFGK